MGIWYKFLFGRPDQPPRLFSGVLSEVRCDACDGLSHIGRTSSLDMQIGAFAQRVWTERCWMGGLHVFALNFVP